MKKTTLRQKVARLAAVMFVLLATNRSWAAVGDAVVANSSVSASAQLDVQPGAGVEWLIHNIHHEDDIELSWYDGTNTIVTQRFLGAGREAVQIRVTNSIRLRIKNLNSGAAKRIGYDGIQTK